jgi:predicted ABC-type ATPase
MPESPRVVVIAGINGAGKSTAAPYFLDEFRIGTYLDADAIARELPGPPADAAVQSVRMMHARIEELQARREDFALETTLSGLSLRGTLDRLHACGYRSYLLYLWLPSAEMAVARVNWRARMGGDAIPDADVLRRYHRSIWNFEYADRRAANLWRLYHAGRDPGREGSAVIAAMETQGTVMIHDLDAWAEMQAQAAQGGV